MSQFLFKMVEEMNEYCRCEEQKELYERFYVGRGLKMNARKDLLVWIEEMLDMAQIPIGPFRKMYVSEFKYNYDCCVDKLLKHIYEYCEPETWCSMCPYCEKQKPDVEFKTNVGMEQDVMVCEDCYNELESNVPINFRAK